MSAFGGAFDVIKGRMRGIDWRKSLLCPEIFIVEAYGLHMIRGEDGRREIREGKVQPSMLV